MKSVFEAKIKGVINRRFFKEKGSIMSALIKYRIFLLPFLLKEALC